MRTPWAEAMLRRRLNLVTNPRTDRRLQEVAEHHAHAGAISPAELEDRLRRDYPLVQVAEGVSDGMLERWYVYREGHWLPDGYDLRPQATPPSAIPHLVRLRNALHKVYAVVERNRALAARLPSHRAAAEHRIAEGEQEIVFLETSIAALEAGWALSPQAAGRVRRRRPATARPFARLAGAHGVA